MLIPSTATYSDKEVDDQPGFYYVSLIDGPRFALLAGPYSTHREALDMVTPAKEAANKVNRQQAAFAGFGTCRLEHDAGAGILQKCGAL